MSFRPFFNASQIKCHFNDELNFLLHFIWESYDLPLKDSEYFISKL